ncbi:hypothetical protein Ccrd_000359 [Cynara cardunculus var. scolymus]|uniref:Uncharacterized protein n=1 Tax=Cynara cardunculus var. scolymus TaxID=59895 RepID=A0A103XV96_CYNCS|nr:hypothetical protein Ccrd_000359 [Cynara cardunculus var. scolymus]
MTCLLHSIQSAKLPSFPMAFRNTNPTITYDSTSSKYHVNYDAKTIETTVTTKAAIADEWVDELLSLHADQPMVVVGLDVELMAAPPNPIHEQ